MSSWPLGTGVGGRCIRLPPPNAAGAVALAGSAILRRLLLPARRLCREIRRSNPRQRPMPCIYLTQASGEVTHRESGGKRLNRRPTCLVVERQVRVELCDRRA